MQYGHDQIKQLTTMPTEKKEEELLKPVEPVDILQADQSEASKVSRGHLLVVIELLSWWYFVINIFTLN